jgi:hypothetical protein
VIDLTDANLTDHLPDHLPDNRDSLKRKRKDELDREYSKKLNKGIRREQKKALKRKEKELKERSDHHAHNGAKEAKEEHATEQPSQRSENQNASQPSQNTTNSNQNRIILNKDPRCPNQHHCNSCFLVHTSIRIRGTEMAHGCCGNTSCLRSDRGLLDRIEIVKAKQGLSMNEARYECYKSFAAYLFPKCKKGERKDLPNCAKYLVRQTF